MLPVFRWFLCGLFTLSGGAALAQVSAQQPEVDESKIPEWVKRQARSPYKVIIESNAVKAKPAAPPPAPPKDDAKVVAKKSPAKAAAPVASESAGKSPPLDAAAASNGRSARSAAAEQAPGNPATPAEAPAAATPAFPAAALPVNDTPAPQPETRAARLEPTAEPPPLTLVKRVEPALTADLLDGRLATAKVVVAFTVTTNGEVSNLAVASTSDPRLNRSVLRAVQAWRYAPIPEPREHMVSFAFRTE